MLTYSSAQGPETIILVDGTAWTLSRRLLSRSLRPAVGRGGGSDSEFDVRLAEHPVGNKRGHREMNRSGCHG